LQVLVKLRRGQDQTAGGLFVASETEKPKEGTVVAAGPGKSVGGATGALLPCPVSEGELVLLSDYTGEKVDYNGEQHMIVDADTVLGVFEDKSLTSDSFRPLGDRMLVEIAEAAQETTTGIALAGLEEEDGNLGAVVKVGNGTPQADGSVRAVSVSSGESVMYQKRAGHEAELDGKRFRIVSEGECLAKW
jgi:chaperonin GroES